MRHHLVLLLLTALLPACGAGGPTATPPGHDEAAGTRAAVAGREVHVPEALQKKWGLVTAPVGRATASSGPALPGVVAVNQQRSAQVSSLLEGKVMSVSADLGDQVRRGQTLVVLHSPAFAQAQTALLQAQARRSLAQREFERARELLKNEAIQQREHQRRQSEFEAATTEYGLAESQLHSFGWGHPQIDDLLARAGRVSGDFSDLVEPTLQVVSPIAGRVIVRDVTPGEHVQPDKLLFVVSDLSTVWALLDAREKDLPSLVTGARVALTSEVYPGRSFDGRLTRVGDVVDEKLRTIKVRVDVPNPGLLLKPNMFVTAVLQGGAAAREVLTVPEEAVQMVEGDPSVFVLDGDGAFVVRPIVTGERAGTARIVLQGLDGSERVAIAGAFNLKAELLKQSFAGEGHNH
ncbi:MAG TPA: efflux RND transporter periplasmic adaptor subunit [Vicinamibacterales bacterium]|nr:efflux RND transporter periplasmic adaptor subunit [Vicinamibacterales bacterium]